MKIPKDYQKIQEKDSSHSRGTIWGQRAMESVNQYLKFFRGKVLEIGCNDGLAMELLIRRGFEVEGIDIAKEKLEVAEERNLKVQFAYQEKIPFKDKSFDTIYSSHTLEHSYDVERAVDEYQRVAKRAIVIVPIEPQTDQPDIHLGYFRSKEDLVNTFKDRGKIILEEPRHNLQAEYVVVIDFKNVKAK